MNTEKKIDLVGICTLNLELDAFFLVIEMNKNSHYNCKDILRNCFDYQFSSLHLCVKIISVEYYSFIILSWSNDTEV